MGGGVAAVAETLGFGQFICDSMGSRTVPSDLFRVSKQREPLCERSLSQVVQDSNCMRNALRPGTWCCGRAGRTQAVRSSEDEAA